MPNYRRLLFGGSVMLLAAGLCLIFDDARYLSAGGEVCNGICSITESTVNDFARGTLHYTGIRNVVDGEIQLLPVGLTSPWNASAYALPEARSELAAVIYRNPTTYGETIYAIGGFGSDRVTPQADIYTATTMSTGGIAAPGWRTVTQSPLDIPLAATQAVISTTSTGGFLYVLGGIYTAGQLKTATILYKPIDINGTLPSGAWSTAELGPTGSPAPLSSHQAFVRNGYLYVVAGADAGGNLVNDIYRAQIQPNGSLGAWVADTPSPLTRAAFAIARWNSENSGDWLYLIGGRSSKFNDYGEADVDFTYFEGSGLHNPFKTFPSGSVTALAAPRLGHTAVQAGGVLYTIGGDEGGAGTHGITNTVLTGLIDSTPGKEGQLVFPWITTNPLGEGHAYHASVISGIGEIYVIGGINDSNVPQASVYHGSTSGIGYNYAPAGNYTSRIIDRASNSAITDIKINAILTRTTGMTLTLQYRVGDSQAAVLGAPWKALGDFPTNTSTSGLTQTFSLQASDVYSSQIQYRAFFTTSYTNTSPILTAFQINYPPPPVKPDFVANGMSVPPESSIRVTQTITYWVSNNSLLAAPVRRLNVTVNPNAAAKLVNGRRFPPPPLVSGASPGKGASPQDDPRPYMVWVSFYAFQTTLVTPTLPISQPGTMNCIDANPLHPGYPNSQYAPFIYYNVELYKTANPFYAQCSVPPNTKNFFMQVDTCDPSTDPFCTDHSHGYVVEVSETNNLLGPVPAAKQIGTDCYVLTTTAQPVSGVSISVNTSPDCGALAYTSGRTVSLSASPASGYRFLNWIGCDTPAGANCSITMNAPKSVTAKFISDSELGPVFLPFVGR